LPQQSSGQPHEASQQPLPQQLSPQQLSPQQPSAQPQLASQHFDFLANRRLRKQPFLHLQPQLEAQPHEASQQLSPQQSSPQQPLPQQSSGQPHEASQPPLPQQPSLQQASAPQHGSLQPHEASQHEDLHFLNRLKSGQPFLHLQPQLEAQPHEASQQLSPQQLSPQQGSSQQPHDFSQQHDGSQLSQPQPPASIRSSKPAPKLGLARQRLITSAPKTLFIEPRLLCMGRSVREVLTRRRGSAATHPGDFCRGDRGGAWGAAGKLFGAGAGQPSPAPESQGGDSRWVSTPRVGVSPVEPFRGSIQ
jgi:hypothetical protein